MFFITILLNEVLAWVRTQPGTSSLRTVLYMDEIFGYFPPTSNPPSKVPMLTLLKQARAFGLGVVLATQNPVDLDYKGLSNAGTWFIGRLQTQRDKDRVLEGLEGASSSAGHAFDRKKMNEILSGLGNRVFVMNNVHEDQPVIFQTRWTLSYLRGPLTREQIQTLMGPRKQASAAGTLKPGSTLPGTTSALSTINSGLSPSNTSPMSIRGTRPVVPPDVPEFFVPRRARTHAGESLLYRPALLGVIRLHYAERKADVDYWETLALVRRIDDAIPTEPWDASEPFDDGVPELDRTPEAGARFVPLPAELSRAKNYAGWTKSLKSFLYRERTLPSGVARLSRSGRGRSSQNGSFDSDWCRQSRKARSWCRGAAQLVRSEAGGNTRTNASRQREAGTRAGAGKPNKLGRNDCAGQFGAGSASRTQGD